MPRKFALLLALSLFFVGCAGRQHATSVKVRVCCWYGTAQVEIQHENRTVAQGSD